MAFDKSNFKTGDSTGNGPSIHTYTSTDAQAAINTAGYFNDISAILEVGDLIYAWTDTGGTPAGVLFAVNANSGGVVDVTDGLAIGTTDTD